MRAFKYEDGTVKYVDLPWAHSFGDAEGANRFVMRPAAIDESAVSDDDGSKEATGGAFAETR
ncbi:MAG: hypothetical protein U5K43_08315 [Halofilum sp. (in: g-proteobacteria)]|nr:hypothetical protein [Halofilum sp. (in: g-proteobacteria)]